MPTASLSIARAARDNGCSVQAYDWLMTVIWAMAMCQHVRGRSSHVGRGQAIGRVELYRQAVPALSRRNGLTARSSLSSAPVPGVSLSRRRLERSSCAQSRALKRFVLWQFCICTSATSWSFAFRRRGVKVLMCNMRNKSVINVIKWKRQPCKRRRQIARHA